MHKLIIKCCRKDTNNFPILQTFLGLFAIIWLLSTPSNHPERHMSHGFREDSLFPPPYNPIPHNH